MRRRPDLLAALTEVVLAATATTVTASAGPLDGALAPLAGRPGNPCALGYTPDESGRCATNSFGFGVGAYPLGYSVGPFANFAPIYGRPYSIYATDGVSQYVIGR